MPGLATVEPYRVRVFHRELCCRERRHVFGHWHAERTNQNSSWTQRRVRDLQPSVESASKGRTRRVKRGLCHGVILLLEDEIDNIAGVGSLMVMVCSGAHDGKLYVSPTTKEGLY